MKANLEDKEKRYKGEFSALKAQSEDLAKILESVSSEREDYFSRYSALSKEQQMFASRERVVADLENRLEKLQKESDKYQAELADTERRYGTQADNLREESNRLNDINKQLLEEVCSLKKEIDTLKAGNETTKDNTIELTNRRATGQAGRTSQVGSPSPQRRDYSELEKENQYLHQMIKNLVQSEDNQPQRPQQRTNNFARNSEQRQQNMSPGVDRYPSPARDYTRNAPVELYSAAPVMTHIRNVDIGPLSSQFPKPNITDNYRPSTSLSPGRSAYTKTHTGIDMTNYPVPGGNERQSYRNATKNMHASTSLSPGRDVQTYTDVNRIPNTSRAREELSSNALRRSYLDGLKAGLSTNKISPSKDTETRTHIVTDKMSGRNTDKDVGSTANLIRQSYLESSSKPGAGTITQSPPKKVDFRDYGGASSYARSGDDMKLGTPNNTSYQVRSSINQVKFVSLFISLYLYILL